MNRSDRVACCVLVAGSLLTRFIASLLVGATFVVAPLAATAAPITVPTGLNSGDQYRLAFVTSEERYATSSNIADYNAFVTIAANSVPELVALGTTWTAIISTPDVDARDNTASNPNVSAGVPIYNLADGAVASSNADLWDGSLSAAITYTETGAYLPYLAWTGSYYDGQKWPGLSAGEANGRLGHADRVDTAWMQFSYGLTNQVLAQVYAMSDVLTVVPEPSVMVLACLAVAGLAVSSRRRLRYCK
jgi:PEP-CTERM motif